MMPEEKREMRPYSADEIRYKQTLQQLRSKIRDDLQNNQESILGSVDVIISDMMDQQVLITNIDKEVARLTEILDKNKIPHERKEKKITPEAKTE